MFKKEEFQSLLERESMQDFLWARTSEEIDGTDIVLYELANNRWGTIFQIYPPFYGQKSTEKKLSTFFKINLPAKSSIQFFMLTSKNFRIIKNNYVANHNLTANIKNKKILEEVMNNKVKWFDKYTVNSIFEKKGIDFRLRNFINLCIVTIPRANQDKIEISKPEIINIFSRVYTGLSDFFPRKFTQDEYVSLMQEILDPMTESKKIEKDKRTYINQQCVNVSTILDLKEDSKTIGIGRQVSKEEFIKNNKNRVENKKETTAKGFINDIKSLFSKDKKEEKEIYTDYHAKMLTTKMYPEYINLFSTLSNFVDFYGNQIETEIPSTFFASLTIFIEERDTVKKKIAEETAWNLWQTKAIGEAARFMPEIVDRAEEAEAITLMLNKGDVPMSAMWSLGILDKDSGVVNKYTERIIKKFSEQNWVLQEEDVIPHWIFLYSLPLQFEELVLVKYSKRMNTLFSHNCAAITPLMTGQKGFGENVLNYVDRAGQVVGVDIFASETNYNFTVVGSSGSGKSYTMADFFTNYLMNGAKIRVIDVGRSYKDLCNLIGGQYIEFTEESNICLNFFTNIELKDGQIHEDEFQTIVPLIGLMAMQSLSSEDASSLETPVISGYISEAVTLAFESRNRSAGMQDVLNSLELMYANRKSETGESDNVLYSLITALYPFGNPDGEYYKYFNGQNNLKFISDFVVLELEEIDSNERLKSVVLAAISHTINTEFFLGDKKQKKILAIDEAWSIMDNKIVVRFLETMARRIRKYNGASGIITQTIGDFYKNNATRAIFDSSATKIFLKQSPDSLQVAQQKGELNLDSATLTLMNTIVSKPPLFSELMFKQDSGGTFLARLITDRLSHWVYTNHPSDMKVIYQISEEFGISLLDAKLIKGYSEENNTTIEEEFNRRLESGAIEFNDAIDETDEDSALKKNILNI